jgi:hypothetical protein
MDKSIYFRFSIRHGLDSTSVYRIMKGPSDCGNVSRARRNAMEESGLLEVFYDYI